MKTGEKIHLVFGLIEESEVMWEDGMEVTWLLRDFSSLIKRNVYWNSGNPNSVLLPFSSSRWGIDRMKPRTYGSVYNVYCAVETSPGVTPLMSRLVCTRKDKMTVNTRTLIVWCDGTNHLQNWGRSISVLTSPYYSSRRYYLNHYTPSRGRRGNNTKRITCVGKLQTKK